LSTIIFSINSNGNTNHDSYEYKCHNRSFSGSVKVFLNINYIYEIYFIFNLQFYETIQYKDILYYSKYSKKGKKGDWIIYYDDDQKYYFYFYEYF